MSRAFNCVYSGVWSTEVWKWTFLAPTHSWVCLFPYHCMNSICLFCYKMFRRFNVRLLLCDAHEWSACFPVLHVVCVRMREKAAHISHSWLDFYPQFKDHSFSWSGFDTTEKESQVRFTLFISWTLRGKYKQQTQINKHQILLHFWLKTDLLGEDLQSRTCSLCSSS